MLSLQTGVSRKTLETYGDWFVLDLLVSFALPCLIYVSDFRSDRSDTKLWLKTHDFMVKFKSCVTFSRCILLSGSFSTRILQAFCTLFSHITWQLPIGSLTVTRRADFINEITLGLRNPRINLEANNIRVTRIIELTPRANLVLGSFLISLDNFPLALLAQPNPKSAQRRRADSINEITLGLRYPRINLGVKH